MPRYFFHIRDDHSEPDLEGTELPDIHAARQTAIRYAGEILNDDAHRVALGQDWRMEVTDGSGLVRFRLDFHVTDVLTPSGSESKPAGTD